MSALHRMAFSEHRQIELGPGDKVIISASVVPGNEKTISKVIDELFRRGVQVVYDRGSLLHATGHACREEMKLMLALVKPKYFIPVHGEHRHLELHGAVAKEMGVKPNNVIIANIGDVIELSGRSIMVHDTVPSGRVFIDGIGVGDVGNVVLRDRKHLALDGMVVVVITLSSQDGELVSGPDIVTRGFVYVKESEALIDQLKTLTVEAVESCAKRRITDWSGIKNAVRGRLSDSLFAQTKRNPMIIPVIMDI